MSDVQIYHAALQSGASNVRAAGTEVAMKTGELIGEDTGIENPASRPALRLELHRRLGALHDASANRGLAAGDLAASIDAISTRFTELDEELNGPEQP